jgi:uncharacterized protein
MPDYSSQIKELEDELAKMQYNKRTQKHYGLVRAKIAKLKDAEVSRGKGGKKGEGYTVRKSGDSTVVLLGFPSAGKSTLLNALTKAKSPVGAYAFTTLDVIPGLMEYKHAKIQVLDVPGIVHGAASGRGRGKEVLAVLRSADLCVMVIDINHIDHLPVLQREAYDAGLRLNQEKPDVKITPKNRGGLDIAFTVKCDLTKETVATILREFKMSNADVVIRSKITPDQFIDMIEANKIYLPSITVLNKMDLASKEEVEKIKKKAGADIGISAEKKLHIPELKDLIFDKLNFIRVYCKEIGKKADLDVPLIMQKGITIGGMCRKLHRDFLTKFKFAKVWGSSAKFPGQRFTTKHKLKDEDVVELHML